MADSDVVATLRGPHGPEVSASPFQTVQHSAPALRRRLGELKIPRVALAHDLRVPAGVRLDLTSESEGDTALEPRWIETPSLRQYKGWIGRPDRADAALGQAPAPCGTPHAADSRQLDAEQLEALEVAGRLYLFGDSRRVASYRGVLERLRGPFRAAVYAARRVVVEPEAALVISGDPAILLFEELVLRDRGQLVTHTATHATFGLLRKLENRGAQALWH